MTKQPRKGVCAANPGHFAGTPAAKHTADSKDAIGEPSDVVEGSVSTVFTVDDIDDTSTDIETRRAHRVKQNADNKADQLTSILYSDISNKHGRFGYLQPSPHTSSGYNMELQLSAASERIQELQAESNVLKDALDADYQLNAMSDFFDCSLWGDDVPEAHRESAIRIRQTAADAAAAASDPLNSPLYSDVITTAKTRYEAINDGLDRIQNLLELPAQRTGRGTRFLRTDLVSGGLAKLWSEVHMADLLYTCNTEMDELTATLQEDDYDTLFELHRDKNARFLATYPVGLDRKTLISVGAPGTTETGCVVRGLVNASIVPHNPRWVRTAERLIPWTTQTRLSATLLWLKEQEPDSVLYETTLPHWAKPSFPYLGILRLIADSAE